MNGLNSETRHSNSDDISSPRSSKTLNQNCDNNSERLRTGSDIDRVEMNSSVNGNSRGVDVESLSPAAHVTSANNENMSHDELDADNTSNVVPVNGVQQDTQKVFYGF